MNRQSFGHHGEEPNERCEFLTLAFSPLSAPLRSRWRNNGLSADFLGDYVTTFLPLNGDQGIMESRQREIRHAVTYIANELLENAMKYHERKVDIPIRINLVLTEDRIAVSASNSVGAGQAHSYKTFVEEILREDAGTLLVRHLEESSAADDSSHSGLGLLTMINDYGARLGWSFESDPGQGEVMTVTTSAILPLDRLHGEAA